MNALVVLPSYNESENILRLIEEIMRVQVNAYICVVDDNSPDGTAELVIDYKSRLSEKQREHLHLIVRDKKEGRGGAVRSGFEWGLESDLRFDAFIEMDCDFSHRPQDLMKGIEMLIQYQIVIGARYPDGEVIGWPVSRRLLSYCSNQLAGFLISQDIKDYTNGFRFYRREAVECLLSFAQTHHGYIYLSESLALLLKKGFNVGTFPIVFVDRERGQSNTTVAEVGKSLLGIFQIAANYRFKR